jgi:hypothetical protein
MAIARIRSSPGSREAEVSKNVNAIDL